MAAEHAGDVGGYSNHGACGSRDGDKADMTASAGCAPHYGSSKAMRHSRRIALVTFVIALLVIIAVGFYRAAMREETRPDTTPASAHQPG